MLASTAFFIFCEGLLSNKSGNKATFLKTDFSAPFKVVCVVPKYPESFDRKWLPRQGTAVCWSHFLARFLLSWLQETQKRPADLCTRCHGLSALGKETVSHLGHKASLHYGAWCQWQEPQTLKDTETFPKLSKSEHTELNVVLIKRVLWHYTGNEPVVHVTDSNESRSYQNANYVNVCCCFR